MTTGEHSDELMARIEHLEERVNDLEESLRDAISEVERSLERRIGNCEDDVERLRGDVHSLERR